MSATDSTDHSPDSGFDAFVEVDVPPSGDGCVECLAGDGWWVHLRRCATCGHIGCCDSSPAQHATAHFAASGHRAIQSFEPGESWFYDYVAGRVLRGPALAPPTARPADHDPPWPADRAPADWMDHLHR